MQLDSDITDIRMIASYNGILHYQQQQSQYKKDL